MEVYIYIYIYMYILPDKVFGPTQIFFISHPIYINIYSGVEGAPV